MKHFVPQNRSKISAKVARNIPFAIAACLTLCGCHDDVRVDRDYSALARDIHISIADNNLVVPFIAIAEYRRLRARSLDRVGDPAVLVSDVDELNTTSIDGEHPKRLDIFTFDLMTYGMNDGDRERHRICPLLTRTWSQSVCEDHQSFILKSLPDTITFVDLSRVRLDVSGGRGSVPACKPNSENSRVLPGRDGESATYCEEIVYGGGARRSYVAVVRIHGNLGGVWTVSSSGSFEASREKMKQEGSAIAALVLYGLGKTEDFPKLRDRLHDLKS